MLLYFASLILSMDIKTDSAFLAWQKSLKPSTASAYYYGLKAYCEFTGKPPGQLIEEAREDYIARVSPWEIRHIKAIEDFSLFVEKDKSANWSKLTKINGIRNFYAWSKIPTIIINKNNIVNSSTDKYLDLPILKIEDIRKFIIACGTKSKLKALILTFISSGQAQSEILKLKGKHLKNIVNGVAIVNITRGKTNQRYTFFISGEALDAIREYKENIKDDEYVFTQLNNDKPLYVQFVDDMFARHAVKLGFDRSYFAPHRARHFFKTTLTGIVDSVFVEYWLGHKPRGTDANYFIGASIQDRMLEAYITNLDKLTVFTDAEVLQKQYDELKGKVDTEKEELKARMEKQATDMEAMKAQMANLMKYITQDTKNVGYDEEITEKQIEEYAEELPKKIMKGEVTLT